MPASPELWVVTPTCGRPVELDATLSAIFAQEPGARVVVVNDAADAALREKVRDVASRRGGQGRAVAYFETPGGAGVTAARILGNSAVPADAVVVEVDDHDTPEPGALAALARAFGDPEVLAVYGDLYKVRADGGVIGRVDKEDYWPGLFAQRGNQAWGIRAYRKRLHDAVGGRDPRWTWAGEYGLFLKFELYAARNGLSGAIRRVPLALCRWPLIGSGASVRYSAEQAQCADNLACLARAGALLPSPSPTGATQEKGAPPLPAAASSPLPACGAQRGAFPSRPCEVSVVVPCWRSQGRVGALAASLERDGCKADREVIWVLDGEPETDYPALPGRVVVRPERGGFAAAVNTGAAQARGRFLCLLNADTEVQPGWLDALLDAARSDGSIGAAAPVLLNPSGAINSAGSEYNPDNGCFQHVAEAPAGDALSDRDMATAACLLIRRWVWDAVGGLDEAFRLGYWEDTDLCMRIRRAGRRIVVAPAARVTHHEGHTGLGQGHEFYGHNRQLFHDRWVRTGQVQRFARERGLKPLGPVCVCMIALNEAEFIGAAIESVYPLADRIIVVEAGNEFAASFGACRADGTSWDHTRDVVESVADPRGIIEIHTPPGAGPSATRTQARQFCLDMVEPGAWALAVDADEVFYEDGLWRLAALMQDHDYVSADWRLFWRDLDTMGCERWDGWGLDMRFFRALPGCRYRTHLEVVNADGEPINRGRDARRVHEPRPLVAHYAWVKPIEKIRAKVEYYRRQCPGRVVFDDYVERVFLADLDTANRLGTHPFGGGKCKAWSGRHPEPVERRMRQGMFGWLGARGQA